MDESGIGADLRVPDDLVKIIKVLKTYYQDFGKLPVRRSDNYSTWGPTSF